MSDNNSSNNSNNGGDSNTNTNTSTNSSILETRAVSRDLFGASIGSVCCCYIGQPFDTCKVRMQTTPSIYSNFPTTASHIFKHEGLVAFWKGAVPTACGMVLENCMAFGVNAALKRAFPDTHDNIEEGQPLTLRSLLKPFAIGALTGCCSATVLLPSDIIKAKTQVSTLPNITSQQIVRQMLHSKQGWKSFFIGFDAQLMRDSTFFACFFGGYQLSCYTIREWFPSHRQLPDELVYFLSGGFAGMGGWFCSMPFDVPKTNIQSRYCNNPKVMGSFLPEFRKIARTRGMRGLYAGLQPTLLRAFPANGALYLGVESGKKLFDNVVWKE